MVSLDLEKLVCIMKVRLDGIGMLTMRGRERLQSKILPVYNQRERERERERTRRQRRGGRDGYTEYSIVNIVLCTHLSCTCL